MVRRRFFSAVTNHETTTIDPSRRGEYAAPRDEDAVNIVP
jgi:hypothetical protein